MAHYGTPPKPKTIPYCTACGVHVDDCECVQETKSESSEKYEKTYPE